MTTDDGALWSRAEVKTQAAQVSGQLTVWDCLEEVHALTLEQDGKYAHLSRPVCSCGWSGAGYGREDFSRYLFEQHV